MPVKVLVVDDSALMRRVIKEMLAGAGCEVDTARNGLDALEHVRRDPPDVVTLDINMPEMDGLTCLARLMIEHPLPVVMVSSLTGDDARPTLEALDLGAVDYVQKPGGTVSLDIETVAERIVAAVLTASRARVRRAGGLRERLRVQRERMDTERMDAERVDTLPTQRRPAERARDRAAQRGARRVSPVSARAAALGVGPRPRGQLAPELVVVGSSTGGPGALSVVLSALPASFPAPVVVAQHIPASFTRHLADRLDDTCALRVVEVTASEPLVPGTIYIGQGDADVVVGRRPGGLVVRSTAADPAYRWHPSVDRLVASAASCLPPERVLGVLLTGMGDDGAEELARLRAGGGLTIAESEETAVVWGMPGELVRREGATRVLPLEIVGHQVAAWV